MKEITLKTVAIELNQESLQRTTKQERDLIKLIDKYQDWSMKEIAFRENNGYNADYPKQRFVDNANTKLADFVANMNQSSIEYVVCEVLDVNYSDIYLGLIEEGIEDEVLNEVDSFLENATLVDETNEVETIEETQFSELFKLSSNSKLEKTNTYSFDIVGGKTCPSATDCKMWVNSEGGITKGKQNKFSCYAVSLEAVFSNTLEAHQYNFDLLKQSLKTIGIEGTAQLMCASIREVNASSIRIHASGDFYSREYFQLWMRVAELMPHMKFYGYTKSVNFLVGEKDNIPSNLHLVASVGGVYDNLIKKFGLRFAIVMPHSQAMKVLEANPKLGYMPNGSDDSLILGTKNSFIIELH